MEIRFYWKLRDLYEEVKRGNPPFWIHITGQLIWREYFYTMGHVNPRFDKNAGNPACLPIPWLENEAHADLWKKGMTGYPFIDAAMRQLYREGAFVIELGWLYLSQWVVVLQVGSTTRQGMQCPCS